MTNIINMPAVLVADMLGMIALLICYLGNSWRLKDKRNRQNLALSLMIETSFLACIADVISFYFIGKPGFASFLALYISNAWLFAQNMVLGVLWVYFLSYYLNGRMEKSDRILLLSTCCAGFAVLIFNIFIPVIFSVDSNNEYSRGPLFAFYSLIQLVYFVDGFIIYRRAKRAGGVLKFFPVAVFLVPVTIAVIVQSLYYGIATIWPVAAIAIGGVVSSVQTEQFFRDPLTGIYNRAYLDVLKRRYSKDNKYDSLVTSVMIDLNGFKAINDNLGHAVGDEALIEASRIFVRTTGELGTVFRYAGDEFFIFLNTTNKEKVESFIKNLQENVDKFNNTKKKPYKLAFAYGYAEFDFRKKSFEEHFDEIDEKMYANKEAYYKTNEHNRRANR